MITKQDEQQNQYEIPMPRLEDMQRELGSAKSINDFFGKEGVFPTDDSIRKLLYLAHRDIANKWTMPIPNWAMILAQLVVYFQGRIVIS